MAHGSLLISIALGLGSIDVPQASTVAMVGTNWRFLKPVKPGMTVHAVWRLGRKRDVTNPGWGLAVWQVLLDDQNEEHLLEGEVTVLVSRGEFAAAPVARSRRRRRGKAPALTAESNLPEPAPADIPPPSRRRRRPASAPAVPSAASPPVAAAEPAVADVVASGEPGAAPAAGSPTTSSRRRRRRRGGGGGAAAGSANGSDGSQVQPAAPPEPASPEAAPAEPPRSQWAAPVAAQPVEGNPVTRVLGRLRRGRSRPAAPSPEGTRSPSE